jgi:hypothetical protein
VIVFTVVIEERDVFIQLALLLFLWTLSNCQIHMPKFRTDIFEAGSAPDLLGEECAFLLPSAENTCSVVWKTIEEESRKAVVI